MGDVALSSAAVALIVKRVVVAAAVAEGITCGCGGHGKAVRGPFAAGRARHIGVRERCA